ncbi:MAG TPA: transglycosylase SLT domain-containing protein [Acidobacteriota bacterium]
MRRAFLVACALWLLALSGGIQGLQSASAQTADPWPEIILDKTSGNWSSLLSRLDSLKKSNPESYQLRQADFLKATALEKLKQPAAAAAALMQLLESPKQANNAERSAIKPLVLWRLFEISRDDGQRERALDWLQQYQSQNSSLVDADNANWQRALLLERGRPGEAQSIYQALVRRRTRFRRPAQLRWSDLETNPAKRRHLLVALVLDNKNDEAAYQAARKLAANLSALSESEIESIADVLMANRDLALVRKAAKYFLGRFADSRRLPFFNYLIGRTWMLENDHEKALQQFDSTYERFPSDKWGIQSKYFSGHVYLRMEKYPEAAAVYRQVIENHPTSEFLGGAYNNLVDALRWAGKWDEARRWAERGCEQLKTPDAAQLAYAEAKIVMIDSPAEAVPLFERALRLGERAGLPPSLGRAELYYWIGHCHERLQNWKAAAASYLESAWEDNNYFGFLSRDSLRNLYTEEPEVRQWSDAFLSAAEKAKTVGKISSYRDELRSRYYSAPQKESDAARGELLSSLAKEPAWVLVMSIRLWPADFIDDGLLHAVTGSQYRRAGATLAGLGFFREAAELLSEAKDFEDKSQQQFTVATFFGYDNHWGEALNEAQKLSVNLPFNSPEFMPPRLYKFFLPLPFSTQSSDATEGLEPELVAAVILRESRFQPDAKSPAGARGLMQLLPSTAKELASAAGLPPPSPEDLYQPGLSVKLGTLHLDRLVRQLKYPEMVVASYNGGSDNVLRWGKKSKTFEAPLFVADIGFAETKSYTMRVMGNYRLYKILYPREKGT